MPFFFLINASLYLQSLLRGNVWLSKELIFYAASQLGFLLKQRFHIQHQPGEPNLDKQTQHGTSVSSQYSDRCTLGEHNPAASPRRSEIGPR